MKTNEKALIARIHMLEQRDTVANKNIINKLYRKLRALESK